MGVTWRRPFMVAAIPAGCCISISIWMRGVVYLGNSTCDRAHAILASRALKTVVHAGAEAESGAALLLPSPLARVSPP